MGRVCLDWQSNDCHGSEAASGGTGMTEALKAMCACAGIDLGGRAR